MKTIAIIGAGPAGIISALTAKNENNKIILIEKNKVVGQKLSITGSGRCNITNLDSKEDFFAKIPENSKFFYSAFSKFSNYDLITYLENIGIPLKYEGQKAYPKNDSAQKTVNTLIKILNQKQIDIKLNEEVIDFQIKLVDDKQKITSIKTNKSDYKIDYLIFATGGMSYCKNTTFSLLNKKNITITPIYQSLVSLETIADFNELSGISLKDVNVKTQINNKTYFTNGDILFTQKGLSGPAIMDMSSYIVKYQDSPKDYLNYNYAKESNDLEIVKYKGKNIEIQIDFLPNINNTDLENIIFENSKKQLKTKLSPYLPERLLKFLLEKYENKDLNNMKKEEKQTLLSIIKNFKIKIKNYSSIKGAIVTKGGVDLKQISPSTMKHKKIDNLYFVGECLDLDALTGGYNLQIAFSTGYIAGLDIYNKTYSSEP